MGFFDGVVKGFSNSILGPDPQAAAEAFKNLQLAMNSKYDSQKKAFEADPANSGKQFQLPTPAERMKDQVYGMIESGNPILQSQGFQSMQQLNHALLASQAGPESTASYKDYQVAVQQGYKGSFLDFKKELAASGRSSVNVSVGQNGVEGINFLSSAEKERLHLPQNTGYYVDRNGQIKEPPGSADLATQQQTNVTKTAIDETNRNLFGKGGLYDTTDSAVNGMNLPEMLKRPAGAGYAFAQQYVQNDPRYASQAAINSNLAASIGRSYLGEKGVMTDEDTARIKTLLPDTVRDTKETAKRKMEYIKRIIETSDPTKARSLVYGSNAKPDKPSVGWTTTASGAKYKVIE